MISLQKDFLAFLTNIPVKKGMVLEIGYFGLCWVF